MTALNTSRVVSLTPIIIFNFTDSQITNQDCNNLSCITVDTASLHENLNPKQLNENKLYGTIAHYFTIHDVIIVSNPNNYINKGTNRLINDIKWRLKLDKNYIPTMITLGVTKDASTWYQKNNNCISCNSLENLQTVISSCKKDDSLIPRGKLTCGLVGQTEDNRVGHITVAFNVDSKEEQELATNLAPNINTILPGIEIKFSAGSVIYFPDLKITNVQFPHITCNSNIKAVLSSKIVEQYLLGIFEFELSDIDPSCKQATMIQIDKDAVPIDVRIVSWYAYYLN